MKDGQLYGTCECGNTQRLENSDSQRACNQCGKRITKLAIGFTAEVKVQAGMIAKLRRVGMPSKKQPRREIHSGVFPRGDGKGTVTKLLDRNKDEGWYFEEVDGKVIRNYPLSQHRGFGKEEKEKKKPK